MTLVLKSTFNISMLTSQSCARRVLSAGDCTLVEQCSCGSVHLTIGGVTLRITPAAFPQIAATISDAARMLVLRDAFTTSIHDEALS
ncbi:MAG: hypothetical protein AB7T06_35155 [Kofleriaceae bacterium]